MRLEGFYFAHPEAFLVPVEHLGPEGLSEAFATALTRHDVSEAWAARFSEAFALWWTRTASLAARDRTGWMPPRRQNVLIARRGATVRPYHRPFHKASWLMHEEDFDDDAGVELGSYLFAHTARLARVRRPSTAALHNLGWFLVLDDEARASFRAAAARAARPDGAGLAALGDAMDWVMRLYHPQLRRPGPEGLPEKCGRMGGANLAVPVALSDSIAALGRAFDGAAGDWLERYFNAFARRGGDPAGGAALCAWLEEAAPEVLIAGVERMAVWDPDRPDATRAVREALTDTAPVVEESIRLDIERAAEVGAAVRAWLPEGFALEPHDGSVLEEGGLTYIAARRNIIAYSLHEKTSERLREPAAPYERLMLAARTFHEWGHLAVESGLVRIADEAAHRHAYDAVATIFQSIVDGAPEALRPLATEEIGLLRRDASDKSAGEVLADLPLERVEDFLVNRLAHDVLTEAELETYVRNNVATLSFESLGPYAQLARYAYEFQYLRLSAVDDPYDYFVGSTWFGEHLVDEGVVDHDTARRLFDAVADLFACYVRRGDS